VESRRVEVDSPTAAGSRRLYNYKEIDVTYASHFACVSDLHLGYDRSFLTDPDCHGTVAAEISKIAGGSADRTGEHDSAGFPASMAEAARSFFTALLGKLAVEELVIVWGNHDFCLWQRLAQACGVPVFTNDLAEDVCLVNRGHVLHGAESFVSDVLGPAASSLAKVTSAYPNYVLGRQWPFVVFHHGHLLDRMVLGWEDAVDYLALKLLIGQGSSKVSPDGDETLAQICRKTGPFVSAMWRYNCHARADEWQFLRRFGDRQSCPYYPDGLGDSEILGVEVQGRGLGQQAKWYLDVLAADPTTPASLGPSSDPSYFFVGHDHGGGAENVQGLDGHDWRLVNTGGWTRDRGEVKPHAHVVAWKTGAASPLTYCVRV
jgi:UDP-2,3-diacylglucosamine pyrophosphatase LpxH